MTDLAHPPYAVDDCAINDANEMGRTIAHLDVTGRCQCLCAVCNNLIGTACRCIECECKGGGRHA